MIENLPPLRLIELDGLADRALSRAASEMAAGDHERALVWLAHHRALRDRETVVMGEALDELELELDAGGQP